VQIGTARASSSPNIGCLKNKDRFTPSVTEGVIISAQKGQDKRESGPPHTGTNDHMTPRRKPRNARCQSPSYWLSTPMVYSHCSTNAGQWPMGRLVERKPKACPPCAYKCISTGTPASFSAM
jgi:hypothetical protein